MISLCWHTKLIEPWNYCTLNYTAYLLPDMFFGAIQYIFLIVCHQYLQVVNNLVPVDIVVVWLCSLLNSRFIEQLTVFIWFFLTARQMFNLPLLPKAYNAWTSNKWLRVINNSTARSSNYLWSDVTFKKYRITIKFVKLYGIFFVLEGQNLLCCDMLQFYIANAQ